MELFHSNPTNHDAPVTASHEILDDSKRILSNFILTIVSALLTIPLFIIVFRYLPDIVIDGFRIDHILALVIIFAVIRTTVYFIRFFLYGLLIVLFVVLVVGQFVGKFGFTDMYRNYIDLISYVGSNPIKIPFFPNIKTTIPDSEKIVEAIDYYNPVVRTFAVKSSQKYFSNYKTDYKYNKVVKYFSIFKKMSSWKYVADPIGEEYFAKASESVGLMSGDCDDYSILMAALIKVIGGEVRLVRTTTHIYPEVKVCSSADFPGIINLIKNKLFFKESLGERIYYHLDDWDNIWLNFDYTNSYPGSEFMSDEIIGILEI